MVDNLKEMFLETLHDLSISVAFLRNKDILLMKSKYFLADVKLALLKYLRCLRELKKKNGEENDK